MPSVVHVVTTANFAGVERYVSEVARETRTAAGGSRSSADTRSTCRWRSATQRCGSLAPQCPGVAVDAPSRQRDLCHAHMTVAEALAVAARPVHRGPVVATRPLRPTVDEAQRRLLAPWIARGLQHEIAVSEFVASQLERRPDAVLLHGVHPRPASGVARTGTAAHLQRLFEPEKDTLTALRALEGVRSGEEGWRLGVVGDGSERAALEAWAESEDIALGRSPAGCGT